MYDLLVIGGGPGGYTSAIRASQMGLSVALCEKKNIGGTCLHQGCIPTKALLHSASIYSLMKRADTFGISCDHLSVNFSKMHERKNQIVKKLFGGLSGLFKKNKIDLIEGTGTLIGDKKVQISKNGIITQELTAKNILLATGSKPFIPEGITIDGETVINSDQALLMTKLPKSIVIAGSGPIGCEFTFLFNALGVSVTLIEAQKRILPLEDRDVSLYMERILKGMGVSVLTSTKLEGVSSSNREAELDITVNSKKEKIDTSVVLAAIGRVPNIDSLGAIETGIELYGQFIKTDKHYETNQPGIYAIGDVRGPVCLAHAASAQGINVINHITKNNDTPILTHHIPNVIYSFPQVASVGLTQEGAREKGFKIKTGRFPFSANGKAIILGENSGFIKVISDEETGNILGVHMVGHEVSELIGEIPFVLDNSQTASPWESIIHPHPTLSEAVKEAFYAIDGKAIHI